MPVGSVETTTSSYWVGSQASCTAAIGSWSPTLSVHVESGGAHGGERRVEPFLGGLAAGPSARRGGHEQRERALRASRPVR